MADYFTNFSLILSLANEAQRTEALDLAHQAVQLRDGAEAPAGFPETLREVVEDWCFETDPGSEPHSLWLHSSTGGIDAVCAFVQHLLQKFHPTGIVTFEWSHDCSKPRTDAYGGGAALITANEIKTMNTAEWLRAQTQSPPAT